MATRDEVLAALRAEDVAAHLGITGQWRGRWLRARRCARTDHGTDAFGLARDGMWHCHACDEGGDLLRLLAISEGLDVRADFPRVLELAAGVAGLVDEDDFGGGRPAPKERPAPPPVEPLSVRVDRARKRAAWVWRRLVDRHSAGERGLLADRYLAGVRGLSIDALRTREDYRDTPIVASREEAARGGADLERMLRLFASPGVAVPVRSPVDGALVDIRVRRLEPREGQPKIVGMLGGVSSAPAETGKGRVLLGCYGFPHEIERDTVIVVEGLVDYLTALTLWPEADVLGAVEAGSLSLVAGHAAAELARRGDDVRLLIVEHADGMTKDGRPGAGDRAVNEEPNAATKVAVRHLGPRRVGWLFCDLEGAKDLNDLHRAGAPIAQLCRWWADLGEAA